nr:hypothetical protein [Abalone asfa-like virus]
MPFPTISKSILLPKRSIKVLAENFGVFTLRGDITRLDCEYEQKGPGKEYYRRIRFYGSTIIRKDWVHKFTGPGSFWPAPTSTVLKFIEENSDTIRELEDFLEPQITEQHVSCLCGCGMLAYKLKYTRVPIPKDIKQVMIVPIFEQIDKIWFFGVCRLKAL